jgi:hypothetical protein
MQRWEDSKAGRREWIGLGGLSLACLLYVMDLTVLHLAVPAISAELQPSSTQLLWIIDIYGFFVAGSLVTMGTLGDRIGRRKLLLRWSGSRRSRQACRRCRRPSGSSSGRSWPRGSCSGPARHS